MAGSSSWKLPQWVVTLGTVIVAVVAVLAWIDQRYDTKGAAAGVSKQVAALQDTSATKAELALLEHDVAGIKASLGRIETESRKTREIVTQIRISLAKALNETP